MSHIPLKKISILFNNFNLIISTKTLKTIISLYYHRIAKTRLLLILSTYTLRTAMKMTKMNTMIAYLQKQVKVRQVLLAILVCICVGMQTSCKEDDEDDLINADLPAVDRNFVANAAQSNISEIELGQLALQKAADSQVKEFAQMMIDMHTAAQNELKALGSNRKFTVADRLDEEHQSIKDQLSALSGADFEKAYINGQVTSHQKTSAIMQTEIDNGQDADVKAYAVKSKPMVDQHLSQAASIKAAKGY